MKTRLPLRRCALLLGAMSWIALPVSLYAGPGGGGHGGGGGSHGGGGFHGGGIHATSSTGGAHFSGSAARAGSPGYAHSGGRISSTSSMGFYGRPAPATTNSAERPGNSSYSALSNFVAMNDSDPAHQAANNPSLLSMARHGWTFLPSAGISRPVAAARGPVRPVIPVRSSLIPAIRPFHPHPVRPRLPYATSAIYPYGSFWNPCFFNGFTSVCGAGPYFYGAFGANYCFSGLSYWNCGYGLGYGPGYGYLGGYGYDSDSGYGVDTSAPPDSGPAGAYAPPEADNDSSNIYMGPLESAPANAQPEAAAPRAPATRIILKNGSAYECTAYWVANGELYYRPVTGGLSHVPLDQLDLSATVEANSRNGVTFTLTDHPPQP